jgi:hypothetical protein
MGIDHHLVTQSFSSELKGLLSPFFVGLLLSLCGSLCGRFPLCLSGGFRCGITR